MLCLYKQSAYSSAANSPTSTWLFVDPQRPNVYPSIHRSHSSIQRLPAMSTPDQRTARTVDGYQYDASGQPLRGLWTDAVVPSTRDLRTIYDVIVIGAGFAGLVAARDLALDRNLRVLLIEARDRIGGRTWTAKAFGEEFEMGGTYVHWYVGSTLSLAGHMTDGSS